MKFKIGLRDWVVGEGEGVGAPAAAEPAPAPAPAPAEVTVDNLLPEPKAEPAPAPAPASEPPAEPLPKTVSLDTFMQRVGALTRQKDELAAKLAAIEAAPRPPEGGTPSPAPAAGNLEAELNRRAEEIANAKAFNQTAWDITNAGSAKHRDFQQAVVALNSTFGQMSREFVEAALEAGGSKEAAADIIHALGTNIDKANGIMMLPLARQAVALAKFAEELKGKPKAPVVSNAPAPIVPAVGRGSSAPTHRIDDPNLPIEEFHKLRAEARAKQGRR